MKLVSKIFKFELLKLFSDKKLLIVLLLAAAVFFGGVGAAFAAESASRADDYYTAQKTDRESEFRLYESAKQQAIYRLNNSTTEAARENALKEVRLYEYYLETQSIQYDFLEIAETDLKIFKHYGSGLMFRYYNIAQFILMAGAVLIVLFVFVYDYETSAFKTVLAAPVGRRQLFFGKLGAALLFQLLLAGVFFVACIACGLFNMGDKFLVYANDAWHPRYCITIFLSQFLGTAVIMLTLTSVSLLCGILSKRMIFTGAITLLVIGVAIAVMFMIEDMVKPGTITDARLVYVPIINIILRGAEGFTDGYIFTLGAHLAVAALITVQSSVIFRKQDL